MKYDLPLTAEGQKRAGQVGKQMAKLDISHLTRSDRLRAKQSTEPIVKETGIKEVENKAFNPWDIGYLAGHKRVEAEDRIAYYINHPKRAVPEGEPYEDFWDRATNALASEMKAAEKTPGRPRIVTTHSCVVMAADALINGEDPKPHVGKMPPPGSITAIEKRNGSWSIRHDFKP